MKFFRIRKSFFSKFFFSLVFILIILGIIIGGTVVILNTKRLENVLVQEGKILAQVTAKNIETGYFAQRWPFETLKELIQSPNVLFYWLVKPSGKIYLADDPEMWGKIIDDPQVGTRDTIVKDSLFYKTNERIKLIVHPLKIEEKGKPWTLYLGISLKTLTAARREIILNGIIIFLIALILGTLLSTFLARKFCRPLKTLILGTNAIAQGNLDFRVKIKTGDELEEVGNAFNRMAKNLKKARDKLIAYSRTLEKRVAKRTKELSLEKERLEKMTKELKMANRKLKEANKMRKRFVSITAHELRTPLSVARWTLEMLRGEDVGKINVKQRALLEDLYQTNQRLLVLVSDLLEVCRIDEDRFVIKIGKCQLEDLIDNVAGEFSVRIREKKLKFVWKKPVRLLPKVKADCNRVIQILENILGNSVKYTPKKGAIMVSVRKMDKIAPAKIIKKWGLKQKAKEYILCTIRDTGMGIPKEEQKRMFSRFFRARNVRDAQIEGTGLGMFIVKQIIDRLEGGIWFESEEGVGTTFYFTLPISN